MKTKLGLVLVLLLALSLAAGQGLSFAAETMVIKGTIIDNACAGSNKATLTEFIKTHPKSCAIQCEASGYSIFSDQGKLYQFDQDSSKKIAEFLKKEDSGLKVTVKAMASGDKLVLESIENQM
ncbi:MAG: hypothetical protein PHN57_01675 [Candidatus Omnitrophica bacterium]|nr:hypothetical protein [Candidatus Omnitrophota bacterium]